MKTNMGTADRIIRLVVAAILVALYFMDILTGTAGIIGLVIAVVFAATALVKFCGLYALLGMNTCSRE
jgi:type III secretory pathway component EscS